MKNILKKFVLVFAFLPLLQVHPTFSATYPAKEDEENIKKTLSYFNNREYKATFKLFYAFPINLATVTTKTSISGNTGVIKINIDSFYTHRIESCFDIRTGKPFWHRWKISSIFGKKDIFASFDNDKGLVEYTLNDTKKTLSFSGQVYDPLSALIFYLSEKTKKGKLEEGKLDMSILWYVGKIYNVSIDIKKEKDKFKIGIASDKNPSGYALFDESGRPLGGEGYVIPVVGHVFVYDTEFENKLK